MSTPKTSRAFTVMSGTSIAEVGRISARFATLVIVVRCSCSNDDPRAGFRVRLPGGWRRRSLHRGTPRHQALPQQAIGTVDVLQPFLRIPVAAIGVRVEALGQLLVAGAQRRLVERPGQVEYVQRSAQLRRRLVPGRAAG